MHHGFNDKMYHVYASVEQVVVDEMEKAGGERSRRRLIRLQFPNSSTS